MFVYLIATREICPKYKIGRSKDPESRIKQLQTASNVELELVYKFKSKYPTVLEKVLHNCYRSSNMINEWFELNQTEVDNFLKTCEKHEKSFLVLETNHFWNKNNSKKAVSF